MNAKSARASMTTKVPTALPQQTVAQIRALLEDETHKFTTINYVYIVSKKQVLKGVVSIKELLKAPLAKPIEQIMNKELVSVHSKTDQEKVAHLAVKHSLKAIPVVDDNDHLLGVVPSDKVLQILDQESEEDLLKASGIILGSDHHDEITSLPIQKSFLKRIPWIMVGLIGGLFTAEVIKGFNDVLSENLILASFIPLVAYVANAVGTQTQTLYIRDIATRANHQTWRYSLKQFFVSGMIALACWAFMLALTTALWDSTHLGFVVGLAISAAILTATAFALLIPFTLTKLKLDPAIGSGPFTTIIQDLLSIIIYFTIASNFY